MGKLTDLRDKLFGRRRPALVSERIPSAAYEDLPPAIAAKLKASARRVRRIVLLRGVCATVATFVIAMLLVMAVDAMVVIFSPWVRWGLWCAAVGATLWTAWTTIRRPLRQPFTPARVAALIEQNHPELEERLSTVVELIGMGETSAASAQLMKVLTDDAVEDAGKVSPRKEFSARTVKPRLLAALVALGIVGALVAAFPRAMGRLITRAVVPSAEVDNIYASSLSVTPGDTVLLEGSPLTIQLAVKAGFPSKAYIRTRQRGESETVERMAQTSADGKYGGATYYTFYYPQVVKSFAYRINCGSALTRGYTCTAVPVPAFTNLAVRLAYPAYTQREPGVITNATPSAIATLAGTEVEISAKACREGIVPTLLLPGGQTLAAKSSGDDRFAFTFKLDSKMNGQWGIQLVDQYGFSNKVDFAGMSVVKDMPPTVRFVDMEEMTYELPSFGQLPFAYTATDDFGFAYVRLEMTDESGNAFVPAMDLEPQETQPGIWTGESSIELAKFDFGKRSQVKFRLAVCDRLTEEMGGPQKAYSAEITVKLVKNATSLEGKELAEQIKSADKTVEEVIKRLESAKHHSDDARNCFGKPPNDWAYGQRWKNLDNAKNRLLEGEQLLSELCANMRDTLLEVPGEVLKEALEQHVTPSRRYCEDIYMVDGDPEKIKNIETLKGKIDDAIAALRQAKQEFDKQAKEALELQKLADFAEREEALAEMAKDGEIDPELWADRQEDLLKEFEKTFEEKLNDPLANEEEKIEALREKGEELKQKQEELAKDAEALKGKDDEARQKAEEDLKDKTQDMPAETSAEDRAAKLEDDLAKEIADFAEKTDQLADQFQKQEDAQKQQNQQNADQQNADQQNAQDPQSAAQQMDQAAENLQDAAKDAQEATDAMKNGDDQKAQQDMKGVEENLDKAGEKLDKALEALQERSDEMRGGNTEMFEEAHEEMKAATQEAREAAENYAKAQELADQQQGEMAEGEQGEQGEMPEGEQGEQGEMPEGEQGEMQQGEQGEQGEMQQGDEQGQPQKGEAQKNAEQAARAAMQRAQQAAQEAAKQLAQAAQSQAQQMGLTPQQMQQLQQQMQKNQQGKASRFDPHGKANDKQKNNQPRQDDKFGKKNRNKGLNELPEGDLLDWFKAHGKGNAADFDNLLQNVPAEYRGLVREYFTELSKEAGK